MTQKSESPRGENTVYYTPPKGVDPEAPFFKELEKDINKRRVTNVSVMNNDGTSNSGDQYRVLLQLTFQKRYVRTYAEIGMKPTRHWRITDVKKYYGVKGGPAKVADQLDAIHDSIKEAFKNT